MIVVGQVTSREEAKEIEFIHQICLVATRARFLANSSLGLKKRDVSCGSKK